jgi:hypothetical protein
MDPLHYTVRNMDTNLYQEIYENHKGVSNLLRACRCDRQSTPEVLAYQPAAEILCCRGDKQALTLGAFFGGSMCYTCP